LAKTKDLQPLKDKWSRIKYVVGLCILLFVVFHIGSFIRFVFVYIFDISYNDLFLGITAIIIQATAFIVVIAVSLKDQQKTLFSVCFIKKVNPLVWFSAILCAVGCAFFNIYFQFLFYSFARDWFIDLGEAEGNFFINLIDIAIIPGIAEEVLFKGVVFTILKKHFPTIAAVIIASLMFALCHFNTLRVLPLFLLSCYTFWLYLKSGNLIIPMLLHFTNNLFSFVLVSEPFAELGTFYAALFFLILGTYLMYMGNKEAGDKGVDTLKKPS